jgi:hypothetical protein
MKKNVAKKIEKRGGGKKVTCPQVPVLCYIYTTIAYRKSVRDVVTIKKILSLYSSVIVTTS